MQDFERTCAELAVNLLRRGGCIPTAKAGGLGRHATR
jgi:hypothetical protein